MQLFHLPSNTSGDFEHNHSVKRICQHKSSHPSVQQLRTVLESLHAEDRLVVQATILAVLSARSMR